MIISLPATVSANRRRVKMSTNFRPGTSFGVSWDERSSACPLILGFGLLYFLLGQSIEPHFSPLYALLVSIISFHGRGFFPAGFLPTMPMAVLSACEAIIGVTIEISFIATFTQRYFGK